MPTHTFDLLEKFIKNIYHSDVFLDKLTNKLLIE